MLAIEWVVLVGVASALFGGLIAFLFTRGSKTNRAKVNELASELEAKDEELNSYRADVHTQFAETAERFKTLDESYHALHRQLATSSVALLGDQATPLLIQGGAGASEDQAPEASADDQAEVVVESAAEATASEDEVVVTDAAEEVTEEVDVEDIVVSEDVPTLTEPAAKDDDLASEEDKSATRGG